MEVENTNAIFQELPTTPIETLNQSCNLNLKIRRNARNFKFLNSEAIFLNKKKTLNSCFDASIPIFNGRKANRHFIIQN